jgi:hypothetical protein
MVIAKCKFSRIRMPRMGAKIAHFTDLPHVVMSTSQYLLYARTWNTRSTVACLAKGIHYIKASRVKNHEVSVCERTRGRGRGHTFATTKCSPPKRETQDRVVGWFL